MTEYEKIKLELVPSLEKFGLVLENEEHHPDVFGSSFSVYSGKGLNYRIIWDGKDGCGYIQSYQGNDWVDLCANAPEADETSFFNAVLRMRIALVEHIALAKLNE